MLANNVGIIDQSYRGNLLIALMKIDDNAPEITLPLKVCQMIFRHQVNVDITEVVDNFDETLRADGGFGSSGGNLDVTKKRKLDD